MEKIFYIYRHTTIKDNNTFHVGKGKNNRAYETQKGRHNSIWEHYAMSDFDVIMLENHLTEDEAFALEIIYIAKYKSLGMAQSNITIGGRGISVNKRWWSEKISKALIGIKRGNGRNNCSYKDNISKSELYDMYVRKKMSSTDIGKKTNLSYGTISNRLIEYGITSRNRGRESIEIKCMNDNKTYKSLSQAAKYYGIFRENIAKVLSGKYKHTGGYKFIKIN